MLEKINIISISPSEITSPRGTPLRVFKMLESLSKKHEVDLRIFTKDTNNPIENAAHDYVANDTFVILKKIIKSNKEKKADIIICHTLGLSKLIILLKIFTRSKVALEMHGFIADEAYYEGNIGRFRFLFNSIIHRFIFFICDIITTCSPTATEIISRYNKNTITVISGANTEMFSPKVKPKYNFKVSPEQTVIGYAGNTRPWQGLDFLLDCFNDLDSNYPNKYRLALLLNGSVKEEWRNCENITILPPVTYSEVPTFLASCDCLVIPREDSYVNRVSFPSKLIEYMSMGKPVVASKTSDMHKIITHSENGLLFEPGIKDDFLEKVESLHEVKIFENISRNSREIVLSKYSWETQIDKFLAELRKTITKI